MLGERKIIKFDVSSICFYHSHLFHFYKKTKQITIIT